MCQRHVRFFLFSPLACQTPLFSLSYSLEKMVLMLVEGRKPSLSEVNVGDGRIEVVMVKPIDKPSASIVGRGLLKSLMHRHPPSKAFFKVNVTIRILNFHVTG